MGPLNSTTFADSIIELDVDQELGVSCCTPLPTKSEEKGVSAGQFNDESAAKTPMWSMACVIVLRSHACHMDYHLYSVIQADQFGNLLRSPRSLQQTTVRSQ